MKDRWQRAARLALGPAVAALFIWLALRHLDWPSAAAVLRRAQPGWLLVALLLLSAAYLARIARWWLMLRTMARLRLSDAAGPFLAGQGINNLLPLRAGDVLRAAAFCDELRLPPSRILGTLVFERLLDLGTLVLVFFVGLASLAGEAVPVAVVRGAAGAALAALVGLLILLAMPHRLRALAVRAARAAQERQRPGVARLAGWTAEFCASLQPMRARHVFAPLVVLSLVAWLLEGGVFAAVAVSLRVADGAPMAPWFAMATGTLGTLIPGTPGYVGTFDYFTLLGFTAYGAAREGALVAALLVHLLLWAPVTLIGVVWLAAAKGWHAWRPTGKALEAAS